MESSDMSKSIPVKLWAISIIIVIVLVIGILSYMLDDRQSVEHSEETTDILEAPEPEANEEAPLAQQPDESQDKEPVALKPSPEVPPAPNKVPEEIVPQVPEETVPQVPEEIASQGPFAESPDLRSQERIKIDPPMMEIGKAWLDGREKSNFTMPVTDGTDLEIEVERFESMGDDAGAFIGSVKGRPGSQVQLSYRGQSEAGTIRIPTENRLYRILPSDSGSIVVQERDMAAAEADSGQPPFDAEIPPVPNFVPPPPPEGIVEKPVEKPVE